MVANQEPNDRTPSTTWEWKRVRIRAVPPEATARVPKAPRWYGRPPRNPREPITIRVKYRGGGEAWYEIEARGATGRFPGHTCLHDVMRHINGEP